jgi:hypothetical protein
VGYWSLTSVGTSILTLRDENDGSGPKNRFSQHSIEVVIARIEKKKPSFHRNPIQLAAGCGNPKDCNVCADRVPVTSSFLSI